MQTSIFHSSLEPFFLFLSLFVFVESLSNLFHFFKSSRLLLTEIDNADYEVYTHTCLFFSFCVTKYIYANTYDIKA